MNNNYANKITSRNLYESYKNKHKITFRVFRVVLICYLKTYAKYLSKGYSLPFLINFGYFRIIKLNRSITGAFLKINVARRIRKRLKEDVVGGVAEMYVPKWSQLPTALIPEVRNFSFNLSDMIHDLIEENISEIPNNMYNEPIR